MTAPQQFPYYPSTDQQYGQPPQAAPYGVPYQQPSMPAPSPYPAPLANWPQQPPGAWQQPQQFQGYGAPQPPAQPLAAGTIDDFYSQPTSGGGAALKFQQIGDTYVGVVARPLTSGDVQQQTNTQGVPQFFKDGRPKFQMLVPLQMQPSQAYPDGRAVWYVKGAAREELSRAMAEAGAPAGPPEAGAVIQVTFTGTRQSGVGMNPAKLFTVRYQRPDVHPADGPFLPAQQPADQFERMAAAGNPLGQPMAQQPMAQQPMAQQPMAQQPMAQQPMAQQAPGGPISTPASGGPEGPREQFAPAQQQGYQPSLFDPSQQQAPLQPPMTLERPAMPPGLTPEQQQLLANLQRRAQ